MTDPSPTPAAPAAGAPTHYDVLLTQAFDVPDLGITIPGGRSIVIASVADRIPAAIVASKTAATA